MQQGFTISPTDRVVLQIMVQKLRVHMALDGGFLIILMRVKRGKRSDHWLKRAVFSRGSRYYLHVTVKKRQYGKGVVSDGPVGQ